ncbi:MAG: ABC transporter ATP-binding protein/permease [Lachnospiraceae bacterium]|nr:ABC transporter ATP-binding protein/permease [Lachnospiraceae bacterium]
MKYLFKYIKLGGISILGIILLLLIQAYCDLSLPSYTSDIVDVGIQQGGLEHISPEAMREPTFGYLTMALPEAEKKQVEASYERVTQFTEGTYEGPVYVVKDCTKEERAALDEVFFQAMKAALPQEVGIDSDSILRQQAMYMVKSEYEALGMDMEKFQMSYLWNKGSKMILFSIFMSLAAAGVGFLAARTGAKIGKTLRGKVFNNILSFSNKEMDQFTTASLITRSTNDIQQVQMVSVLLLRMVTYAPILGIGGIIRVSTTRTGMTWIIAVAVIAILTLVGILMKIAMPKFKIMQTLVDDLNLVSREILTGIPVVRAFSREKHEEERFDKSNTNLMRTQLFTNRVMTFMMPTMMMIMNAITVLIVWMGAKGIQAGNLQVGDMMAFITYTMQIVMSFLMLTMLSIMLPRAGVAAERIEEVLNTKISVEDPMVKKDVEWSRKGLVEFQDVSFTYPGAKEPVLEHISFTAKPGETTAIIGSTGCGKTTLLNLIPRFYDVTEGKLLVDGVDIRTLSQNALRDQIGLVPQKAFLFSGTIESNLKFAGSAVTEEKMVEAATIAQATDFIAEKDGKYESEIAQGGTNVSGGQKQRLAIARAIAKNPLIYLFDDSFSALDYKTDAALRKALEEKTEHATVIIVAQRISTVLKADNILVLEEGKIVGQGTHNELMQTCEAYQEIAKSQLSEEELKGGVA